MGQDITAALKDRESNKLKTRLKALDTIMNTNDKQLGRQSAEDLVSKSHTSDMNAPIDMDASVDEYNERQKIMKLRLKEKMS